MSRDVAASALDVYRPRLRDSVSLAPVQVKDPAVIGAVIAGNHGSFI